MHDPNLTRRTLTRLLGGASLVGSTSFVDVDGREKRRETDAVGLDERQIELATGAELAEYRIVVDGDAEPGEHADTHEHEYQDTVECEDGNCEIYGYVTDGGIDDFIVSGEILFAGGDESVTATVSDVPVGEFVGAGLGTVTEDLHLELTTGTDLAEYWLTVDGDAKPGEHADTHEHTHQDTVECDDGVCEIHGYVGPEGLDDFHVEGRIVDAKADEQVTGTATGTIPGGIVALHPDEEITVAPGTRVQFEARGPDDAYRGRWWVDGEEVTASPAARQGFDYGYGWAGFVRHTFESRGTYQVVAGEDPDDEDAASWTIHVERDGAGAPNLVRARPDPDDLLAPEEPQELTVDLVDPDGRLDRVVWWETRADVPLGVSSVRGNRDDATLEFQAESGEILVWLIDEQGAVTRESLWTVELPEPASPVERHSPDEEITVAPGTAVQFEVGPVDEDDHPIVDWFLDGEFVDVGVGPWQGFDLGHGPGYWSRHTFESEGTYEYAAEAELDGETDTVSWTVHVEPGGAREPNLVRARPDPDVPLAPEESHELTVDLEDPDGRLDRVVWWLTFADAVLNVSDVAGDRDAAALEFQSDLGGVVVWVLDEDGAVVEEPLWTVGAPDDDPDDPDRRHLELSTDAEVAEYWLTVEGHAEPGEHADTHEHEYQDTVECEDGVCEIHGYVADGGIDDFYVEGEIVAAGADEPVTATIDGETVPIEELAE